MRLGEWTIGPTIISIGNRQEASDTTDVIFGNLSRFAAAIAGGFDDIGEKRLVEKLSQGLQRAPVTGLNQLIISVLRHVDKWRHRPATQPNSNAKISWWKHRRVPNQE